MLLEIHPENPQPRLIRQVADCLLGGGIVVYPTDTIYGLGCDIYHPEAIERLCRIKGVNPSKAQFSFICKDLKHLSDYSKSIDNPTFRLLRRNLPGPFTFILPSSKMVPKILQHKKSTVGIRVPDNNICLHMLEVMDHPIISTSLPGELVEEYTDPEVIHEKFGHLVDIVVSGGVGGLVPSTIVDCTGQEPLIIRQGLGTLQ
jgi:tRNA threonylcarbamoyl adenosine modification protein (Sua5/YciO/YrdC/YwlC family)